MIINAPFSVFFIEDRDAADDERELEVKIEDEQSLNNALRTIARARREQGEPDYFVVEDEDNGSVPLADMNELYEYIKMHYTRES